MMSYKTSLTVLSLLLIQFITCQETTLSFMLDKNDEECLMEYFPDKTLVIYEIHSNITDLKITIKSPDSVLMEETSKGLKYPFTTYTGGYYEVCLENNNRVKVKVEFSLKYGVAAKDYSSIARTKDLLPIDLELEKLADRTKRMNQFVSYAQTHEHLFEASLDSVSSKIVLFSCIIIAVMIIIGTIETIYLRKFMERRKII